MKVFDLIGLNPADIKIHLATHNGREDPIDVYFRGDFKTWQEDQNNNNFTRTYVLSLIRHSSNNLWLFAGVYRVTGAEKRAGGGYTYATKLTEHGSDLIGRMIVSYTLTSRATYRLAEKIADEMLLHEIKAKPLYFDDFSNYKAVLLSRSQLCTLFNQTPQSWKTALSAVSGVYLISDSLTGKLYVGSAYGENGIWQRWEEYFNTFHGGNKLLKALHRKSGEQAFSGFTYSILETMNSDSSPEEVIAVEGRWKDHLLTREYGYNDS